MLTRLRPQSRSVTSGRRPQVPATHDLGLENKCRSLSAVLSLAKHLRALYQSAREQDGITSQMYRESRDPGAVGVLSEPRGSESEIRGRRIGTRKETDADSGPRGGREESGAPGRSAPWRVSEHCRPGAPGANGAARRGVPVSPPPPVCLVGTAADGDRENPRGGMRRRATELRGQSA
ncbi:hypothetical protein NDU88_011245 [Pleurodeles waltl]|uniref:Uncharacterized protein n=1 Tax=Pleurodeles waltl TaxID=8319 RepID=A0AAV7PYA6_PLEWA|nr:hypothetical protein NDU88_011245 [Pleurodeles waltl]